MNEKQLEEALQAWPLAETPAGFSESLMEQLRARQLSVQAVQGRKLRFRLTWSDYVLGISLSLLPALVIIAFTFLPRKFFLYVSYQWMVLRSPTYEPVLLAFVGVAAMLATLAFLLGLRYILPRRWALF